MAVISGLMARRPRSSATRRACRPSRSGSAGSRGTTPGGSIGRPGDERRARQDTDLMADAQRLEGIVGDQHGGAAGEQPRREVLQLQPGHGIEMGERLVHQHDRAGLRTACGRAPRAGACRRTSASGGRRAGRPDRPRPAARGPAPRRRPERAAIAAQAIAQQDIVEHRQPRQQQVGLGHVGDRLARGAVPGSRPASQRSREVLPTPLNGPAGRSCGRPEIPASGRGQPGDRRRRCAHRAREGEEQPTSTSPVPTPVLTGSGCRGRSCEPLSPECGSPR